MTTFRVRPLVMVMVTAVCPVADAADKETLVVTATGFEQKIQDAPASISVISKQQIEDKAYRDITDALKDVPGVVVTGEAAAVISVFVVCLPNTLYFW